MNSLSQGLNDRQNRLPFKGLSPAKAYIDGDLVIVCRYKSRSRTESDCWATISNECNSTDSASIGANKILNICKLRGGEENRVLIGDVEKMKADQVGTLPARIRLHMVEDFADDSWGRTETRIGMSLDGSFKFFPVFGLRDRELDVSSNDSLVVFDQDTISVIEGGPEVVNRIAQDSRRVGRKVVPNGCIPNTKIVIGPKSIFVLSDVIIKHDFELSDVMFGPFGL